jgi:hypothetical protein
LLLLSGYSPNAILSNTRVFMFAFAISTYICVVPHLNNELLVLDWRRVALDSSTIRVGSPSLNESYPRPEYPGYLSHRSLLFATLPLGEFCTSENVPTGLTTQFIAIRHVV